MAGSEATTSRQQLTGAEAELAALERAWGSTAYFFRTGFRYGPFGGLRARSLGQVHDALLPHRMDFEENEHGMALLYAIRECAEENLPLPDWLSRAFVKKLDAYASVEGPHSLDTLFRGRLANGGKRAVAQRRDWVRAAPVAMMVPELRARGMTFKDAVDEARRYLNAAGVRILDAGRTTVRKLVMAIVERQKQLLSQTGADSHLKPQTRKTRQST